MIRENVERVRKQIAAAVRAAGRDPSEVRLIAVTKGVPADRIREAVEAGITEIGENRVQEAREKKETRSTGYKVPGTPDLKWHLIGHLQRNKAAPAVELFDMIHSVDSPELIQALDRQGKTLEVLIQVNVSGEPTKHGCVPQQASVLAEQLRRCRNLRLAGLMTIAPFVENPEQVRPVFRKLRLLRDELQRNFGSLPHLSMGMSHDFEVAVQEGATMVRVGTAIFGERTA